MKKLKSLERLIDSLSKLPSVGRKSAERMAYAILEMDDNEVKEFSDALLNIKKSIHYCKKCGMITDEDKCPICDNPNRDKSTLLVVSYPKDVFALEKSDGYKGLYHVLGGEISLSKGKNIEDLSINLLLDRIEKENIKEVILATNPTIDGETTALYIAKLLSSKKIKVTRLAYGLTMGGNLDYTDQITLLRALEGRRSL